MTLANRLTLLRLALLPVFMTFMIWDNVWTRLLALLIFIGASITDWYDGALARRTKTVTVVGTLLDPLVDKMLIATALVGFVELREIHVPAWMVVIIIGREFLITGLRMLAASRGRVMAAEQAGKTKMVSQITAVITILIILVLNSAFDHWPTWMSRMPFGWPKILRMVLDLTPFGLVFIATLITLLSGILYIRKNRGLLKKEFAMPEGRA
ncbi:MAG: CDP-diacylglycerol--glycerol-3-phosphate 3-phosphatidyltransferase [Elusimicrobiota bacterium]|jgi:CDP-diacylglycerol--glycerol-3-phosphate 3-phosphatidyltransferase